MFRTLLFYYIRTGVNVFGILGMNKDNEHFALSEGGRLEYLENDDDVILMGKKQIESIGGGNLHNPSSGNNIPSVSEFEEILQLAQAV